MTVLFIQFIVFYHLVVVILITIVSKVEDWIWVTWLIIDNFITIFSHRELFFFSGVADVVSFSRTSSFLAILAVIQLYSKKFRLLH